MSILVFLESAEGKIKKTSYEAAAYAVAMAKEDGDAVTAIAIGAIEEGELAQSGRYGVSKVLHVSDERLNQGVIQAYASVLAQAIEKEGASTLVLAKSSLGDPVAARLAVKIQASLASNVVALPDRSGGGFKVKRSIYTGKAFAYVDMTADKKIIAINKNVIDLAARSRL